MFSASVSMSLSILFFLVVNTPDSLSVFDFKFHLLQMFSQDPFFGQLLLLLFGQLLLLLFGKSLSSQNTLPPPPFSFYSPPSN